MKKSLILDVPEYINSDKNAAYIVQQKVFEFVEKLDEGYLKDYEILYNYHSHGKSHIEKLIQDWDLKFRAFSSSKLHVTSKDKADVIKDIIEAGKNGYALIFFDHNKKNEDIGNKIILDQCYYNDIFSRVCRLEFGNKLV